MSMLFSKVCEAIHIAHLASVEEKLTCFSLVMSTVPLKDMDR